MEEEPTVRVVDSEKEGREEEETDRVYDHP